MNDDDPIASQPLWRAAELMEKAVALMARRSGSPWPNGYEDTAEHLITAWNILGAASDFEPEGKCIDKALVTIDLAMAALASLRAQWKLLGGHTEPLEIGDTTLEIGDFMPAETREEVMEAEAIAWLDGYGEKLKSRAAKLRPIALRMRREGSDCISEDQSNLNDNQIATSIRKRSELSSMAYTRHPGLTLTQFNGLMDRAKDAKIIVNIGPELWQDFGWAETVEKYKPRRSRGHRDPVIDDNEDDHFKIGDDDDSDDEFEGDEDDSEDE